MNDVRKSRMTGTFRATQGNNRATLRPGTIRSPTVAASGTGTLNRSDSQKGTLSKQASQKGTMNRSGTMKNIPKGVVSRMMAMSHQKVASLQTPIFFSFRSYLTREQVLNKRIQLRYE
jgi:hypothetical protein